MTAKGWVKLHRAIMEDGKMRGLSPTQKWIFVCYIMIAQHSDRWRGYLTDDEGHPMTAREKAYFCGVDFSYLPRVDRLLVEIGLIELTQGGRLKVRNWAKYQGNGADNLVDSVHKTVNLVDNPVDEPVDTVHKTVSDSVDSVHKQAQMPSRARARPERIKKEEGDRATDDSKPTVTGAERAASADGDPFGPWMILAREFIGYNPAQNRYGGAAGNAKKLQEDWDGIRSPAELTRQVRTLREQHIEGRSSRQLFDEIPNEPHYRTVDEVMAESARYAEHLEEELRSGDRPAT